MKNLQELPRFGDKLSYLYMEHASIDQCDKAVAAHDAEGSVPIPAAGLAVLMLGPGTSITHAAIKTLADNNCQVIWTGEDAVRFYAQGLGGSRHSRNIIQQARLVSNDITRLQVVIRMYCIRFREAIDPDLTLQQLRGKEGIRVRQAYAEAARTFGINWQGRSYKRQQWDYADPINRALSSANACLYGLVHAAILSGGYSTALGFIHTGKQLSFVYDVADLYKADYTIPTAFAVVAGGATQLEREVRLTCRETFRKAKLMERILPDIEKALNVPPLSAALADQDDAYSDDAALPADLWQPACLGPDTPIGTILKLDPLNFPVQEKPDDRHDTGASDTLSAG